MTPGRRLKRFWLQPEALVALLKGTGRVAGRPLPPDAAYIDFGKDADRSMAWITVHSATFDVVGDDLAVPASLNGPIIEED